MTTSAVAESSQLRNLEKPWRGRVPLPILQWAYSKLRFERMTSLEEGDTVPEKGGKKGLKEHKLWANLRSVVEVRSEKDKWNKLN